MTYTNMKSYVNGVRVLDTRADIGRVIEVYLENGETIPAEKCKFDSYDPEKNATYYHTLEEVTIPLSAMEDDGRLYSAYQRTMDGEWYATHRLPLKSAIYYAKEHRRMQDCAVAVVPDGEDPAPYLMIAEQLA
jgi:hypothetical protein